jgi:hypothetical protein
MQRPTIAGDIFGYVVCLLATLIFFVSAGAIVNNAFQVAHPTAQPHMFVRHAGPRFGGQAWAAPPAPGPGFQAPAPGPGPQARGPSALRDRFVAGARYNAVRRLVVALVMLILSIAVFRRTFVWLNPRQAVT